MFANGLANGSNSFCALGSLELLLLDSNCLVSKVFEGIPTFFMAILVVSFENMMYGLVDGTRMSYEG